MKTYKFLLICCWLMTANTLIAQTLNWHALTSQDKHLAELNFGWDYGTIIEAGYSYHPQVKIPTLLHASVSAPFGKQPLDDLKSRIGAQSRILAINGFMVDAGLYGIYRRNGTPLVTMNSFGSEFALDAGYYKPKWFVALESGFDKAIVTSFNHTELYKTYSYSDATNGWYSPPTGGNLHYGIKTGYTLKSGDLTLRLGKVTTQDFKTTPLIPFYLRLGYQHRFSQKKSERE